MSKHCPPAVATNEELNRVLKQSSFQAIVYFLA